jgi:hypothetical protein
MVSQLLIGIETTPIPSHYYHYLRVMSNSIYADNAKGLSQAFDKWYETLVQIKTEEDVFFEIERFASNAFERCADVGSLECLKWIYSECSRSEQELNEALFLVCDLAYSRTGDIEYYSTREMYSNAVGFRKQKSQIQMIEWLVSRGANLQHYDSSRIDIDANRSIERRMYFPNIVQTVMWYHNTSLLHYLCIQGLTIDSQDIEFLFQMLEHQEHFPFIEELFQCVVLYVGQMIAYDMMMRLASHGEYFLLKTYYLYIHPDNKIPQMYVEIFQRCPSYIIRQWIIEIASIDHSTLNRWIEEYPCSLGVKKRKLEN